MFTNPMDLQGYGQLRGLASHIQALANVRIIL